MSAALTHLIPVPEMAPGQASKLRNEVIRNLVQQASKEMSMPESDLVARDIRFVGDLQAYSAGTTDATIEDWVFTTAADATTGFVTITGDKSMADQRFMAIFGVTDLRSFYDDKTSSARPARGHRSYVLSQVVSLLKISVGGADKVIWDLTKLQCYTKMPTGMSPSAVVIPQNATYNISIYKMEATSSVIANIILDGIVVEPRGKLVSP